MMSRNRCVLALLALASTVVAQGNPGGIYNFYQMKAGSCPPPLPVQICSQVCSMDYHCEGMSKCCPTSCGGTTCSWPVTMTNQREKPGSCPAVPKGRWVCSPTCSSDSDCRGIQKCCKNRCGALACQEPEGQNAQPDNTGLGNPNPNIYYNYN